MPQLKLPVGISNFRNLRNDGYYFIDKSQFIVEITSNSSAAILIPRPRRFGKTLNMSMLQTWYEKLPTGESHTHLIDGLKASSIPGEHHQRRGKIPVIFFSFKDVKEPSWGDFLMQFAVQVALEIERLSPWWQNKTIPPTTREVLHSLEKGKADKSQLQQTLRYLSSALHAATGERPLLLIDEYDTPVQAGLVGNYFQDVVDFIRNFLSAGIKDNADIWKAVLTGILRVSKENMFSGLNNLQVCSLTNKAFHTCFGLLETEVESLLRDANLSTESDQVQQWYNGYRFGENTIYNPWSVINFVAAPHQGCCPYWVNSGDTRLLGNAISDGDGILHCELEDLLLRTEIEKPIDDHVTYSNDGIRPTDVWSFLLYTGYLKTSGTIEYREEKYWAKLSIPNQEIAVAFSELIRNWTSDKLGRDADVTAMLKALVTGDEDEFVDIFTTLVNQTLSFHDVKARQAEAFYHAFVAGLLVNLKSTHLVRSNRESGHGRYDVLLQPKDLNKYPGVVIEFKIIKKDQTAEIALAAAHEQMIEKKYATELYSLGCNKVLHWAIAFKGKEVFISLS